MKTPNTPLPVALGALLASTVISTAATWTSTATGGSNWSDPDNWSGDVAPVNGEAIVIGIPVLGGIRITNNDHLTNIGNLTLSANATFANGNPVTLDGNTVSFTAGGSNVATIGLAITLSQNTNFNVSANTSNGRLEVGGGISGAFDLTKNDPGRLRFAGTAKTYSGNTIVSAGILDVATNDMLPFGAGKGNVLIGAGGELFLNNVNTQINGLSNYNGTSGTVGKGGSNTRSLTLGNNNASGNFSGNMTFSGGSSTISKVGTGTQILSGNISTAGAGSVSAGTLLINGSWNTGVTASGTGTLGGSGNINGAATIAANAFLAPGASIGSLAVASSIISGTLKIEYDGGGTGTIDLLNVTNALDITNAIVDFSQLGTPADDASYVFATYGSLVGTKFAAVQNLPNGYSIHYAFGGNNIALVAIPEPATALLGALGLLGMIRRRR